MYGKTNVVCVLVIATFALLFAACGQSPSPGGVLNGGMQGGLDTGATDTRSIVLTHQASGSADLLWSHDTLSVTLHLVGLAPMSTHPAHIHQGTCQRGGPPLFLLHDVVADAFGVGTSTTTITGVKGGIASQGWFINAHNGPLLTPAAQFLPIACGNIRNDHHVQALHALPLGGTTAADQNAAGQAHLFLKNNTLTLTVIVHGLVPGSVHMEHIHAGSCQQQGKVLYPLPNLVAVQDGTAHVSISMPLGKNVSIPKHGWYLNVHRTSVLTDQNGHINQTNFDPIACGNIE